MSTFKNLLLEKSNNILSITINRPDKLNALNKETIAEIGLAFQQASEDKEVKSIILTGAGEKAFVAGADISEFTSQSPAAAEAMAKKGHEVFAAIEGSRKPVIAVVNGFALGGGCELAMACHMRIATANAKFGQPEVNLGLIPGYGGTQRLTQLIGKAKALELLMTADMIGAEEAKTLGLANHVAENKEAAIALANSILDKINSKAPIAVGLIVDCVNDAIDGSKDGYATEAKQFGACFGTKDFVEGATAFMEKRKANFKGE